MGRHKLIEDDELLARVRDVVVKEGITVSSRRIAEAVGVSSAVLFQRYGSKENLLFAALSPPAPDMSTLLRTGERRGHGLAQLERVLSGLLAYFRQFVPVLAPLANHPAFDYEAFRERHPNSPLEKLIVELSVAFEEQRQRGELDCPDVGMLVLHLVAVAHSLAMFEHIGAHHGTFSQHIVSDLARLLWRGVAPAEQREPPRRRAKTRRDAE